MVLPANPSDRLLSITLALGQYPILGSRIRALMRTALFQHHVIEPAVFEDEVREKAVISQDTEGVSHPLTEEPPEIWEKRVTHMRDHLTDVYFSRSLPLEQFEEIIHAVLSERGIEPQQLLLSLNPELAPPELLFQQAAAIEKLPVGQREQLDHRLREIKVVLIRLMISDQLGYINIAKQWFTVSDLADIRRRKIGSGRIGGKAAGMLLAARIIEDCAENELSARVHIPESYFMGSDLIYSFMALNNLVHWNDQKYKAEEQMREEYPQIQKDFEAGIFPEDILARLKSLLETVGKRPMIVRSSSLLEDNFGTSFAGKYESYFLPNQASLQDNLEALTQAVARIYATVLNPNALLYRRSKGLQDYDERMAILIQIVEGETYGRYYLPQTAGVAFSRNLYRWSPQIREEDGFVRLVWGLGTRAVDRLGADFPRMVALSHPLLRPSAAPKSIRHYSQQVVDLIDLEDNTFKSLPVRSVLRPDYPPLRYLAQLDQDGYFSSMHTRISESESGQLTLTFEDLLRRTDFAPTLRRILKLLEEKYNSPVDVEFTARIGTPEAAHPDVHITIIQCRPQSHLQEADPVHLPLNLPPERSIFCTRFMVPKGCVTAIRYVVFVPPEDYYALPTPEARSRLSRIIGQLNKALAGKTFICVGPGRWGSTNTDLGVPIEYADIYNARALVELTGQGIGSGNPPEPSFGTHFFQDLLENQTFPLAISLDDADSSLNREFFYATPNVLKNWVKVDEEIACSLRLIDAEAYRPGMQLELLMDNVNSKAVAFLLDKSAE
jgi:hypothetical protein